MIVGMIALFEIAVYFFASGVLSSLVLYPVTVILIVVLILSLNIVWIRSIPTATDIAQVFSRGGKGAIFRWTKDSLAIAMTTTFLIWFVASVFAPLWYYPMHDVFYGTGGEHLLAWEMLGAFVCLFVYMVVGQNLPERTTVSAK
jgi:hypothetical protein